MAIYTYKCPGCGLVEEKLIKSLDEKLYHFLCPSLIGDKVQTVLMKRILSVPSPLQWGLGCKWN
jgi:hypothetical protein